MRVKDLKPNKKNPRRISQGKLLGLKGSLEEFGDMGGIVFNVETGNLVGGHQRSKSLPPDAAVKIDRRYETPTKAGTVAEGSILVGEERFTYREVRWDTKREAEAMLAANNHGGETDRDLLAVLKADFPDLRTDLAGLTVPVVNVQVAAPIVSAPSFMAPAVEAEEESDEAYAKRTSGAGIEERMPTVAEELNQANAPAAPKGFDKVEERMNVVGKRHVIIIDCTSEEHKKALKELIESQVKESGGKFF